MKIFKMMLMVWALASTGVMAQDYYAPTDKEKEPVARFPFDVKPEIKIENGEKVLKYTLPKMLTGNVNVIRTTAVDLPGLNDLPNPVKMFVGEKATITCMGTDANPGCMVTHRNLSLNKDLAYQEIDRTYFDPELRLAARKVVDDFQSAPVEHSGNQPIGVIGALKDRQDSGSPSGTVKTQFDRAGTITTAWITWKIEDGTGKFANTADFKLNGRQEKGSLTDVKQFGNRVRGRWSVANEFGWFDFEFNNAKTRFEGFYGVGENGSARVGRWTSVSAR
jgi:hypothetical protein